MTHATMAEMVGRVRPGDWVADPGASTLNFAVRDLKWRTVTGHIPRFCALPFRRLAGPAAVLFWWPPRPSGRQEGTLT